MTVQWRTMNVPLASGINTRPDERALPAPGLLGCSDGEFTEVGGIQKRKPYLALSTTTDDGGTLADHDVRRIVSHNGELIAFTKSKLWSYSPGVTKWVQRDEHLAVNVVEEPGIVRQEQQEQAQYVEHSGIGFWAWIEGTGADRNMYLALTDAASGAVLFGPTTIISPSTLVDKPSLVALDTWVCLAYINTTGDLTIATLDPADGEDAITNRGGASVAIPAAFDSETYDLTGLDDDAILAWQDSTTTQYRVAEVNSSAVVSQNIIARTCDGAIAIAARGTSPNRAFMVFRGNGTNVEADLLDNARLVNGAATATGTSAANPEQMACAFKATAEGGGEFRCFGFWSSNEADSPTTGWEVKSNYADTNNTAGTEAHVAGRLGIASRAFERDDEVFVWLTFGFTSVANGFGTPLGLRAQLQNTYFLYRTDGFLAGQCTPTVGGGFNDEGFRHAVQDAGNDTFIMATMERRRIPVGDGEQTDYAAQSPRIVRFTFDSDLARRTVSLGKTLYIAGSIPFQYDGDALYEVGFLNYPWYIDGLPVAGGSISDGARSYVITYSWTNANGERERSTSAVGLQADFVGGSQRISFQLVPLTTTRKRAPEVAIEIWRTEGDPGPGAPYHLTTDSDPSVGTGDNSYIENDYDDFVNFIGYGAAGADFDNLTDAQIQVREVLPSQTQVLQPLAPPPASIITAGQDRIFLAGVPGDTNRIHYSLLRAVGETAAFNDGLTIDLPHDGGAITGLAFLNETLVAFKSRAIFAIPGQGFDNLGGGQNYGPPSLIAPDLGAISQDTIAVTPDGIIFKSEKGWYMLDRGLTPKYIGGPVADFDGDTFVSAHVIESKQEVRLLSTSRCLVFDYNAGEWSTWSLSGSVDATLHNGVYHVAVTDTVSSEEADHSGTAADYPLQVETAWIKLTEGLQGYVRVRNVLLLGEYRTAHRLRIEVARDYDPTYFQTKDWTVSPTTVGGPLQVRHGPSIQKMQAVKFRITDLGPVTDPSTGEALKLTGLALELGYKSGSRRDMPAAQKQ